jgi:RHS repeat-associated protein
MPGAYTYDAVPRKFTGKERDNETATNPAGTNGLDYFGARYLTSSMGRFMSPDGVGEGQSPSNPQSWNRYAYTQNNPINSIDPNGHDCVYLDDNGGTNPNGQGGATIDHSSTQRECDKTGGLWANGTVEDLSWVKTDSDSDTAHIFSHYKDVVGQTWAGPGWSNGDEYANTIPRLQQADNQIDIGWALFVFFENTQNHSGMAEEDMEYRNRPMGRRGKPLNMGPEDESLPPTNPGGTVLGRLEAMRDGSPIRDGSAGVPGSESGFLRAERNLLRDHGWELKGDTWYPPNK